MTSGEGNSVSQSQRRPANGVVPRPAIERLKARLVLNEETGCHEWTGALDAKGYARIGVGEHRNAMGHRVAYEAANGAIPQGLHLDHLCRNRACCNPDHLEPVTPAENTRRGFQHFRPKTHCRHGHEYTPENTILAGGPRRCRVCKSAARRAFYERHGR